jgi:tetratricopeptide (TPR) repeat protein
VGALVTILGSAVGVYLQAFPKEEPAKKPETAGITFNAPVNVQGTGTNVVGSQNVTINQITTGYPIEEFKQSLKARDQELREELREAYQSLGQSEERRKTIELERQGVQSQLGNLQKSYEEQVAELKRLAGELEALRGQVPDAKLREALDALAQGRTKLADALLAEVESNEQAGIERAARAAFERGRIAYQEVRWQEARSHFEKADRLVPNNADYSWWAARLAWDLGDYSTATRRYEAILERLRKEKGEDAPETTPVLNNLAGLYRAQGRFGEAEPLFEKALAIDEKALPANHPDLATDYNNLAGLYQAQGRFSEAEPLFIRALEILERRLGPSHPNTVTVGQTLAALLTSQGRADEASALLKRIGAETR